MTEAMRETSRDLVFRRPTEGDQPGIVVQIDDWFAGRHVRHLVGRTWFRHSASTSWVVERPDGLIVGLVLGVLSQDRPIEAVLHLVAVHPSHRRRGIGRALVDSFVADVTAARVETVTAVGWPGEPIATTFFAALGFRPEVGPGSVNRYGTPAWPDYEAPGEDRVIFVRRLPGG